MPEHELSERLRKVLRTYNIDGDVGDEDLAKTARLPAYDWLAGEFEEALLAGAFTTETWGVCYNGGLDPEDTDLVDRDLRYFWAAIFPERPYPLDAPSET
ncbi:MAG TPA: hypothetical protein VGF17_05160 [Phytomonospora sp.]